MERLALEDPGSLESIEHSSWMWHDGGQHSPWSNQWNSPVDTQWNSPVDTTSSDPRQYGDGRGEVTPPFDGTDFRESIHGWPRREELVSFWRDEGDALDLCDGIQDWQTPKGVEILLDHLRR